LECGRIFLIMYSLRPKSGSDYSEGIHNRADIVFDYNPAIGTDYASTTVRLVSTGIANTYAAKEIAIYPNPSTGKFYIDSRVDISHAQAFMLDMQGKSYPMSIINNSIDASSLAAGNYILYLQQGAEIFTAKVVVE